MKSPRHMRIIEIDITNACNKRCSNCTRLCGHHKKPYYMNFDTFKRAVDSLDGYQGIRSIMGGEPTLHPEFERFIRYLGSKFPVRNNPLVYPQKNFIQTIHRIELDNFQLIDDGVKRIDIIGAGMFSNMGSSYKKHYEVISDLLPFQGLNDHQNPIYHQSALITRKELGIPDNEWPQIRDDCWLQNEWSAGITPKGAFFCEIAGVLDMMLDGPGGWAIEPGWWKREPKDFGDQLHWCEYCGFCLDTFTRNSAEEIDDISEFWYKKLQEHDSPKVNSGRINVIKIENNKITEDSKKENKFFSAAMPYIEHYEDRFNSMNSILFTHEFIFAIVPDGADFGIHLNELLASNNEWFVLHTQNAHITDDFADKISAYVLNPGTLHYLDLSKSSDTKFVSNAMVEISGYAALFNKRAISLRELGFDRIAHLKSFDELIGAWQPNKIVELSSSIDEVTNLPKLEKDKRYVIWGTGSAGSAAANAVNSNGSMLVFSIDRDERKHGKKFYGTTIESPKILSQRINEFDYLIVANYTCFPEIKYEAVHSGIPENKILLMADL